MRTTCTTLRLLSGIVVAGLAHSAERVTSGMTPPVAVLVAGEKRTADIEAAVDQVFEGVNRLRREAGVNALAMNAALNQAARKFAAFMAETERYGHDADGHSPGERAGRAGYAACIVAENLAYQYLSTGFRTTELSQGLLEGWMDSSGHRANLLDPDVTETGVAITRSGVSGKYYAVQVFGRPKGLEIAFSIRNLLGRNTEYRLGAESHPLPAGTTVTHRRCRPATLRFPGAKDASTFAVRNDELFEVVSGSGGELRIERATR